MIGHSDARLAARVRAGDERAFELLVQRHRAALVSYCRRLGLDGRAEDAVQQAFLSAWLALRGGQEVRDVRSWLGRIAHNKAVDLLRTGAQAPGEASSAGIAPGGIEQTVELRDTLAAVAALPPRQRDALLLSAIDGRSYEDVARALGVSEGAVRGLLHRARATLRAAAGALTPLPLLRRASMPVGRVAELATANGAGSAAGTTWRAAAAAVTTAAVAAGVAVGPLHSLITGHPHDRRSHATPTVTARVGGDHRRRPSARERRDGHGGSPAAASALRAGRRSTLDRRCPGVRAGAERERPEARIDASSDRRRRRAVGTEPGCARADDRRRRLRSERAGRRRSARGLDAHTRNAACH